MGVFSFNARRSSSNKSSNTDFFGASTTVGGA